VWAALGLVAVAVGLGFIVNSASAIGGGATLVVDDDGQATANNCNSGAATPHSTISSAIAAVGAGNVIKVCPGTYTENLTIDKALTLKGAKAGESVKYRTFGGSSEATVMGLVTIQAADVKLEGFSLTNPGQALGVIVKTAGSNAEIKKNIVQTVGSNTFAGPTVGMYLELGPDNVKVLGNKISDIQSQTGSAQGILVGDSTSADPSLDTRIDSNFISNITSEQRGAYGIQANNGASTAPTATGYTELSMSGNTIKTLRGNWVHAIGLEGETPNAEVLYNTINDITDTNPVPTSDTAGVFFESNPFFFTSEVNQNNLAVTPSNHGIVVHPTLASLYPSLSVDGECNWWGSRQGPGAVASGNGSMVSSNVDYRPWLKSDSLGRDCGGRDHHDNDRHYGDWAKKHDWYKD